MGQGDHCRSVAWQMSPEVETLVCAVLENRPQPKALIANGQCGRLNLVPGFSSQGRPARNASALADAGGTSMS